jgi:hypothetical protein
VCQASVTWRRQDRRQSEARVEKSTESKINLIMQHKTKNLNILADNIHDIRTEQI